MSNATKFAAAICLAGATLAFSPASHAQDMGQFAYTSGAYGDCYYDPSLICGPVAYGSYGSYGYGAVARGVAPYAAYAAINGAVQSPYATLLRWRGLRGGDWVAIHGSGGSR